MTDIDPSFWWERVQASSRPSPFLTPAFVEPWVASFAGPLKLGVWRDCGLILFHRGACGWELVGGQDVADRLDGLVEAPEAWEELRREVAGWDGPVRFPNLGPDAWALAARRPEDELEVTDQSPYVALPGSFAEYLNGLAKKPRHELQRKMRRAERLATRGLRVTRGATELEDFLRLHRLSHPDKAEFMHMEMESFFRSLCARLDQAGMLWLSTLRDGQQALASVLQIRLGRTVHLYNSGYDPERAELAPGLVLIGCCLREACQQGYAEYDFLRGTERYKYDLGGQDRPVYRLTWRASV